MPRVVATVGAVFASLAGGASAEAASPRLNTISPPGVQRGAENVLTFSGSTLNDAAEIFFYSPGFEVTKLEPVDANSVKATIKVAADCRLGEHVAQVRTKSGISDYRTFYVGPFPIVGEQEPNSQFNTPQKISLNVTIHGCVDNEDVDYYLVEAKKGDRISAEIEGMRLGMTLFDPYISILDSKRFDLAPADDTALLLQDAFATVIAPEDGTYVVEVRDSAYGGNGNCQYRLHVGAFPRPTAVFPAGGKIGEEIEVKFLGDAAGEFASKFKLPDAVTTDFGLLASLNGQIAPSENVFRLFPHGNNIEAEPNDDFAQASPSELPLAFNGIISKPGDTDFYRFKGKAGEVWDVECYARRIRSALDPVMYIFDAKGAALVGDDDTRAPDSYFRFTVPADGEYLLRITDHLGGSGPDYVYRVEFTPVLPSLTVGIPRVERYGQYRQTVYVPRGNRFGALVTMNRANFGGPVALEPKDLPQGITMHAEEMPANLGIMPVVFEAAADAPVAGKLVDFRARHSDPNQPISGGFYNRADFVIAEPGQSLYRWRDVEKLAVAVIDELPFQIEIVEPKVPLVQNGSMQLKITAKRAEGFDKPITVEFPFRPPGVGAASSVTIPQGQNEVLYPLSAEAGAEIKKWKVFALGYADVNGSAFASSQLATLEIAAPYVSIAIERSAVEQGKQTEMFCKVTNNLPFEGAGKVKLIGLPHLVTAPELEITKDTKELAFKISTDAASPAGTHKNVFCEVLIPQNGEQVVHARVGDSELRIDQPLPMPAAQPQPAAAPAQPAAPAQAAAPEPKRLTRLEQLRVDAKQRATAPASQ